MDINTSLGAGYQFSGTDVNLISAQIKAKQTATPRPTNRSKPKRKHKQVDPTEEEKEQAERAAKRQKEYQVKQRQRVRARMATFLNERARKRLNRSLLIAEVQPRKIVEEKIAKHGLNKEYGKALRDLPKVKPTAEQLARLADAQLLGPKYLGRTASLTAGCKFAVWKRETNGFTTRVILMPAADTHKDQAVHASISRMTQGEIIYMLGHHLIWTDA